MYMLKVNYYLDRREDRNKDSAIMVVIGFPWGQRKQSTTGLKVYVNSWDKERQRAKGKECNSNYDDAVFINDQLEESKSLIRKITRDFESKNNLCKLSNEQKKVFINQVLTEAFPYAKRRSNKNVTIKDTEVKKHKTIFDYIEDFKEERGKENCWTEDTYYKFTVMKNHLMQFKPDLTFDYMDKKGMGKYCNYLIFEKKMRNSTVEKQMEFTKWFLNWAYDNGYSTQNGFRLFKPHLKKITGLKEIVYLTDEEIKTIYEHQFSPSQRILEEVRDVFLFCCSTSLRYSDVQKLKKSDIARDIITVVTKKTSDSLRIDLNYFSKQILQKYENYPFLKDKALPVMTNQEMNRYLKKMAKLCGLNRIITRVYFQGNERKEESKPLHEWISTHAARRSFVSHLLIQGQSVSSVMKFTGHSDFRSMKNYIGIADKDRTKAMNEGFNPEQFGIKI